MKVSLERYSQILIIEILYQYNKIIVKLIKC